jgi:glycosyltransferase involved in cell wall biosynthesis
MLVVITTHPIQYQVPLWQALARDGRVPFEVWYLTHHAVGESTDKDFGRSFAWDIDLLAGYPHRRLAVAHGATPTSFYGCRLTEPLAARLKGVGARAVWVQGWQVLAYWQAVWAAKRAGCQVWLRAESNDLSSTAWWKKPIRAVALSQFFDHVDSFLCIGSANRRLYRRFGIPDAQMSPAPYAVDNDRFAAQAEAFRSQRRELRRKWGIPEGAFCVMFCGKFVGKKRPFDLIEAARDARLRVPHLHLLFVGSGELGETLRAGCKIGFDAEAGDRACRDGIGDADNRPPASFVGFLNQTEISKAYVAADCLVLPSDYGETWGLVVNEAMASGLACVVSDRCGSTEDLGAISPNRVFPFASISRLAECLVALASGNAAPAVAPEFLELFSFDRGVETAVRVYSRLAAR